VKTERRKRKESGRKCCEYGGAANRLTAAAAKMAARAKRK